MKIKYLLLSVFMLALWSCETDMENPDANYPDPYLEIDSGDADFSTCLLYTSPSPRDGW